MDFFCATITQKDHQNKGRMNKYRIESKWNGFISIIYVQISGNLEIIFKYPKSRCTRGEFPVGILSGGIPLIPPLQMGFCTRISDFRLKLFFQPGTNSLDDVKQTV